MTILAVSEPLADGTILLTVEGVGDPVPVRFVGAEQWRTEYLSEEQQQQMVYAETHEFVAQRGGHPRLQAELVARIGLGALNEINPGSPSNGPADPRLDVVMKR